MFESCRAHFAMKTAARLLPALAASLVVAGAAAKSTGEEPMSFAVRLGASGAAVYQTAGNRARLLRLPDFRDITPQPLLFQLDDVEFVSGRTGWVASADCTAGTGVISRTDDGGRTWRVLSRRFTHTCNAGATLDLEFIDRQHGWLVWLEPTGPFAEIYRTADGGRTWRMLAKRHTEPKPAQIAFLSARRGWGVWAGPGSGYGPFLRSEDGGSRWTRDRRFPAARYAVPEFRGRRGVVVFAVRWSVFLRDSNDGGLTWRRRSRLRFGGPIRRVDLNVLTPDVWWITVDSGQTTFVAVTADGGRTWTRSAIELPGRSFRTVPTSVRRAWTSPRDGRLFATVDGGRTWRRVRVP